MATHLHGTPFKPVPEHIQHFPRPGSPDQPLVEPLSPVLGPNETPFTRYVKALRLAAGPAKPQNTVPWTVPRARDTHGISEKRLGAEHRRKSSNTIDELAQIALAVGPSPTLQTRRPSYSSVASPATHPYNPYAQSLVTPPAPPPTSLRSQRRSWSAAEIFTPGRYPDVHSRKSMPNTIYTDTPNVNQDSLDNSLEAAALLLNFAGQAPKTTCTASTMGNQTLQTQEQQDYSHNAIHRPSQDSAVLDYLPSPKPTSEEYKGQQEAAVIVSEAMDEDTIDFMEQTSIPPEHQSYIQTPPEDEAQETPSQQDRDEDSENVEDKPKRRGWPKGKPRGSKKSSTSTSFAKTKGSSNRRTRKPAGAAKSDDVIPATPRRKSYSDTITPVTISDDFAPRRSSSVPASCRFVPGKQKSNAGRKALPKFTKETVCQTCKTARESLIGEMDQWISCNGCKKWFHSDCAGFKSERDVRDVDKFFCKDCEPENGATTFVRKSTRAHTSVDYAGLNQGVLKTSDDCNEHHYIRPIKDGTFTFDPETFPRMPPELVTAEYFERSACFNQPILIPADMNPKPLKRQRQAIEDDSDAITDTNADEDEAMLPDFEYDVVNDDGQDKLDMVIPQDLTVRHVCNLVGSDFPLEVIDVKVQGTEGGKWNLGKWADYYDTPGDKPIRNVISLEVAETKLGRLLRRPKIVRQIDLQDNVWPKDEPARSVAFYCLMSVADSYTDFHIDFGGSSVYYHILRGSKTFFFIPPKPKHLKAYEDWNNSPEQNFTFLPHTTKECYRVDLFEGDTMLIPSGWIHAVWTPSNSLVIGGNFLTRMHYAMQLRVVDVERANKTPLKFRYPKFQKVMWYAVIKYLEEDPLPDGVRQKFYSGEKFSRDIPAWQQFDDCGDLSEKGSEEYHARYYPQTELDGLPELANYIFRTIMISMDRIEGITVETRRAVMASIPKGYGPPLEIAKTFALWVAWKRGNEDPPRWAHPDFGLPDKEGTEPKKLSTKVLKQKQRQEAFEAYKMAPERQSARQKQQESIKAVPVKPAQPESPSGANTTPKASLGPRRVACEECRRRRIRCKHKEEVAASPAAVPGPSTNSVARRMSRELEAVVIPRSPDLLRNTPAGKILPPLSSSSFSRATPYTPSAAVRGAITAAPFETPQMGTPSVVPVGDPALSTPLDASAKSGRSKACADCRRSKRRCIHDENGKIDPFKEKQAPIPRGSTTKKRKNGSEETPEMKRAKKETEAMADYIPFGVPLGASANDRIVEPLHGQALHHEPMDIDQLIDPQLTALMNQTQPGHAENDGPVAGGTTTFAEFAAQALDYSNGAVFDSAEQAEVPEGPNSDRVATDGLGIAPLAPSLSVDSGVEVMGHSEDDGRRAQGQTAQIEDVLSAALADVVETVENKTPVPSLPVTGPVPIELTLPVMPEAEAGASVAQMEIPQDKQPAGDHGIAETTEHASTDHIAGAATEIEAAELVQDMSETKEQTPSANDPPSLSSASSPLSMAESSPEPVTTPILPALEPVVRHSARNSKPVERFASSQFEGSKLSATALASNKIPRRHNGKQRKSTSELPGPAMSTETSPSAKRVKTPSRYGEKQMSRTPVRGEEDVKMEGSTTEDESLRLARELTFGLRRRGSLG